MIRTIKEVRESKELSSRILDLAAVMQRAKKILAAVKSRGDAALLDYTETFDRVSLTEIEVKPDELEAAKERVDDEMVRCIEEAATAIRNFHYRQKKRAWLEEFKEGLFLGEMYVPFDVVGAYVPGSYFSSALMCVIPAKIAGVREIVVCTPPGKDGHADPLTLVAAKIAGATKICKVGGAQAIASLAFGTQTIPQVDKIIGAGNLFVTLAKQQVYGIVGLDGLAGPTETMVIADEYANPRWVAADLLAQAEHDILAKAILLTPNRNLAQRVQAAAAQQIESLSRADME